MLPPRPKGKRGPNQIIGNRQLTLKQRLVDPNTKWTRLVIPQWYGQQQKVLLVCTAKAIWYKASFAAIPLQWVLIKDPENKLRPMALLCTDMDLSIDQIINFFIRRWTVEVTFEETRAHLGVETQRQWSDKAIQRTTPALMALFSIITLWADYLYKQNGLSLKTYAWYQIRACLNFLTTENQWFIQDRFLAATLENWKGWKFGGKQSYSTVPFFHFSS
jgi:hypothetical protein